MPPDNDSRGADYLDQSLTSSPISPVDGRSPAPRFESITHVEEEEEGEDGGGSAEASGTLRRPRPPALSTRTNTYGFFNSPGNLPRDSSGTPVTPRREASVLRKGSLNSLRQVQSHEHPSENRSRKPNFLRRASSRHVGPHKGQEFSVDDDPKEFEKEHSHKGPPNIRTASGTGPFLRTQPSTLRRRPTAPKGLPSVISRGESEEQAETQADGAVSQEAGEEGADSGGEDDVAGDDDPVDEDNDLSDAESFTLRDRQAAINETHPFGIRIWKPALYKKNRSVEKTAEGDIHSSPGGRVSNWLWNFNLLWTILFGWWLSIAAALGALTCFLLGFTPGALEYGKVLWGLAKYLFFPFGKFVKLHQDEAYLEEDEGEGRSITEYEQWQSGDLEDGRLFFGPLTSRSLVGRSRQSMDSADEDESLLGRTTTADYSGRQSPKAKRRLFGRGQWTFGRIVFFGFFYFLIAPLLLLVSLACWFLVFWIPMGKVTLLLFYHLRRHPLALSFHDERAYSRGSAPASSILLCTYRAVGLKYWKYTIDGTNIFLINLIGVVLFAIFDYWVLGVALGLQVWIVQPGFVFALALFSIIPLAYFIGQAVASISAQSSMGVGAAINAFFSTVVEVFLYCVALNQGKSRLVEGSIIGSIFAGILFLPGLSMCFGALKRKTQRFNVKSAGVTSTMLLFAVIAAFGPTLFYQIYGSHELNCHACIATDGTTMAQDCRRCYFSQNPAIHDRFFMKAVRPYCWFAAVMLFLSYVIGLWFTLRTHAAVIWSNEVEEKKSHSHGFPNGTVSREPAGRDFSTVKPQVTGSSAGSIRASAIKDSQLYKRILGQSLKQVGLEPQSGAGSRHESISENGPTQPLHMVPPKTPGGETGVAESGSHKNGGLLAGLSEDDNHQLVRQVAEMAATAATVAARDATRAPRKTSMMTQMPFTPVQKTRSSTINEEHEETALLEGPEGGHGGHDAPNWSRSKSAVILLGATVLYAVIAEILVNTVDVVLESVDIDEKFLGITLFALVPNTTEFLNAISFAMNGNIALSMEIGSAYALQVCLLQIPALVLFSAIHGQFIDPSDLVDYTFDLIFPQWDMVTVILCVFLLSYMYGEGKSNYFKGSILVLTYLVVVVGFYVAGFGAEVEVFGPGGGAGVGGGGGGGGGVPLVVNNQGRETFRTVGRGLARQGESLLIDL